MSWKTITAILLILQACSEKPADPGLCNLSCGDSIIGPLESDIEVVAQSSGITCASGAAGSPLQDPLSFYFRISERVNFDGVDKIIPKPNISIEPIVNGIMSEDPNHNPNVTIVNGVFTPARYKGIITPSSNWCSDACGVVSIEVFAVCPPAGESSDVTVQIHSGAKFSQPANITVQTQDAI